MLDRDGAGLDSPRSSNASRSGGIGRRNGFKTRCTANTSVCHSEPAIGELLRNALSGLRLLPGMRVIPGGSSGELPEVDVVRDVDQDVAQ